MTDYVPKNRYEDLVRTRYLADKARLRLWNAAAVAMADPMNDSKQRDLRAAVEEQAKAAERWRESVTYYESWTASSIKADAEAAERSKVRTASVIDPVGQRCLAEVSDHDSRWPRFHQCSNRAKGRADLKDWGPTDLCGMHIRQWSRGRSVWPHKEDGR